MHLLSLAIRLVVLAALLWLAIVDVRERRLPTPIVLAIAALFFVDAGINQMPLQQLWPHLIIAVLVFVICGVLFAAKMLGGGDAKLGTVIFLWTGSYFALPALTLISIIGIVVSLLSLATRNMERQQTHSIFGALAMFSSERGVPYGVALALGGGTVILLPALKPLLT